MPNSPLPGQPRVAIIIVNWNGWRECIECIDSVLAQAYSNFHLFIVDNDSSDQSVEHIVAWCRAPEANSDWREHPGVNRYTDHGDRRAIPLRVIDRIDQSSPPADDHCQLTLIRSGGNSGFAGGCNIGIKAAGLKIFDYFWFLNPDTVVERRALSELVRRAQRHPDIGIVGSTVRFYDAPNVIQALAGGRLNRLNGYSSHIGEGSSLSNVPVEGSAVERELAFVFGASMLVSRTFVQDVGEMAEDYFLYYEEIDWAMRGLDRYRLGYAPQSHIFHKSGANSSKVMPMYAAGFFYRNRLRFVKRYLPDRLAAAKRKLFEEMLRHLARGRWGLARVVWSTLLTPPKT